MKKKEWKNKALRRENERRQKENEKNQQKSKSQPSPSFCLPGVLGIVIYKKKEWMTTVYISPFTLKV